MARTNPNSPWGWRTNKLTTDRDEALRLNLSRFVSTTPCKRGHTGMRYTANNSCVSCMHEKRRERRAAK